MCPRDFVILKLFSLLDKVGPISKIPPPLIQTFWQQINSILLTPQPPNNQLISLEKYQQIFTEKIKERKIGCNTSSKKSQHMEHFCEIFSHVAKSEKPQGFGH